MLSKDDLRFLRLLSEAAFANPFGSERGRLDRRLADARRGEPEPVVFARVLERVRARLDALPTRDVRRYDGEERSLVEQAVLFDAFHRFADRFDALIRQQARAGERSVRVDFGREALASLAAAGLEAEEARRAFAFFFQLRRAFYFIGQSLPGEAPSMRALRERLWANVFTHDARLYARVLWRRMEDFSTILLGETGTGKGIAAAAIGRSGWIPYDEGRECFAESFVGSFLSINLSQFPDTLIESELFGHKKGAFTGAIGDHAGVFARASAHGSILLDEIGELSVPVQIKLLRVLQERTFAPVGGHEVARFGGRVIAATNRSLDTLRSRGQFRDDFYYRLCSDVVEVPSLATRLREDPAELDVLLAFILQRIVGEDVASLRAEVRAVIDRGLGPAYAWPGNVRELEQCVRRVVLTRAYTGEALRRETGAPDGAESRLLAAAGEDSARTLVLRYCRALYQRHRNYEEVARRTGLDRRTVKAYVTRA